MRMSKYSTARATERHWHVLCAYLTLRWEVEHRTWIGIHSSVTSVRDTTMSMVRLERVSIWAHNPRDPSLPLWHVVWIGGVTRVRSGTSQPVVSRLSPDGRGGVMGINLIVHDIDVPRYW